MDFKEEYNQRVELFEGELHNFLPIESGEAKTLYEAMNYSVLNGGKRLRPIMLMETCRIFGKGMIKAIPFAVAMELIHSYSLVHDDLPAMDNDELRRGKPTTHKAYGEAIGILAGDGLLNLAYEVMADAVITLPVADTLNGVKAMSIISHAAGSYGMIGGQCADVESEKNNVPVTENRLIYTYHNKTGALISASLSAGAALAGANDNFVQEFRRAGVALGDAFQIRDDILDIKGSEEELGKPIGSDAKNEKVTYVSMYGIDAAKKAVEEKTNKALTIIKEMPIETEFLVKLFESLIARES